MDPQPTPDLLIRASRPDDAPALAALLSLPGVRFGTLQLPYVNPDELRRRMEGRAEGDRGLLAFAGDVLVGSVGLHRAVGRRAHAGEIGMAVHDAWTGRGIGTALLAEVVAIADRWLGLRRLELTVYVDNVAALALYRGFGFEVEGTHRAYALRDGTLADAHTMARVLSG